MEISKEDIENVENALKVNSDYKLNNTKFDVKSFEKGQDNEDNDFEDEKEELINFLLLTEEYDEKDLQDELDPSKIREDYKKDYSMIYSDESLNRVQKSLALKELVHMSICQVVNDLDLFFTRPYDLTPEENAEKNRQEAKALENELQLG